LYESVALDVAEQSMTLPDELLVWWREVCHKIPGWAEAAEAVGLVQPSSAICERVFSIVQRHFPPERRSMLRDSLELGVMLAYNRYRDETDKF
jgi:hAT family C-terminal dimerisation region